MFFDNFYTVRGSVLWLLLHIVRLPAEGEWGEINKHKGVIVGLVVGLMEDEERLKYPLFLRKLCDNKAGRRLMPTARHCSIAPVVRVAHRSLMVKARG